MSRTRTILIIGDWVVDEYWFLVKHHSDISSHTGFSHYRLANRPDEFLTDLCGAGYIARILFQEFQNTNRNIYGLGVWNNNDTRLMKHLIHCRIDDACKTNFVGKSMINDLCNKTPNVKLFTLQPNGTTTKVVRTYHQLAKGIEQINRIDWAPENESEVDINYVRSLQLPSPKKVDSIVAYDLKKDGINDEVVQFLVERYPDADWYIRTKDKEAGWINSVQKIKLSFLGPEVTSLLNPWGTWLVNGRAKKIALNNLDKMVGENAVLVSGNREVILKTDQGKVVITKSLTNNDNIQLGWSSALFAKIIFNMVTGSSEVGQNKLIEDCVEFADKQEIVTIPKVFMQSSQGQVVVKKAIEYDFQAEYDNWKASETLDNIGCISIGDTGRLDVWRASSYLPGYVSCIKEKNEILCRVGSQLNSFRKGIHQTRSLSIMLQADPGSGKTHLAKTLADAFNFSFFRFDVTQMIHRDEIIDLFDSIATRQAYTPAKILVFVDEINACLAGHNVFSSFLAPLEEGFYSRRGRQFVLKPCAWLFAGTKIETNDREVGEKLSDFESRMTLIEKLDYESLGKNYETDSPDSQRIEKQAKLEQIYLGAIMIKNFFPDVRAVSKEVLRQFKTLNPANQPARKIRWLAESLRNVQHGVVTRNNCTQWGEKDWSNETDMIKLIF